MSNKATRAWKGAIEPAETGWVVDELGSNFGLYSEDFTQGGSIWVMVNLLPFGEGSTVDADIAPDGTRTADLLIPNTTSSNSHYIRQNNTIDFVLDDPLLQSVYVKVSGYDFCHLRVFQTDAPIVTFDLNNLTTTDDTVAGIELATETFPDAPDDWYRIWLSGTIIGLGPWAYIYVGGPTSNRTFAGDGISGLYFWGHQLEKRGFAQGPGPYRKTTNSKASNIRIREIGLTPTYYAGNAVESSEYPQDWGIVGAVLTPSAILAPKIRKGYAAKIEETVLVNGRYNAVSSTFNVGVSGNRWKFSMDALAAERTHLWIGTNAPGFPNNTGHYFDLVNGIPDGTFGTLFDPVNDISYMIDLGDGWYRCYGLMTADTTGVTNLQFGIGNGADRNWNGEAGKGIYINAIQVQRDNTVGFKSEDDYYINTGRIAETAKYRNTNFTNEYKGAIEHNLYPLTTLRPRTVQVDSDLRVTSVKQEIRTASVHEDRIIIIQEE